jgi:hypothetical protein
MLADYAQGESKKVVVPVPVGQILAEVHVC